jgi:polysaccharide chain length determinant protein (PEP-CTERM system associated)
MDKVFIADLLLALKAELIRFRISAMVLFIATSFAVLLLGAFWPKTYSTSAVLMADVTSIIEPLMKGSAELTKLDRSEQAREVIHTRAILEVAARQSGLIDKDASTEQKEKVVKDIRASLVVKPEKNNYFQVMYNASDADKSFDVLNAVINAFLADTEKKKRDQSQGAYNFIDAQVQMYKHQLEQAEEKLKEFKSTNLDGSEVSVESRIAQLRSDIENLKIVIEESQARVNTLQRQLGTEGQYQHAKGLVDEMKQRKQYLTSQLENLLLNFQEDYPDVVQVRTQLKEINSAIAKLQSSGEVYSNTDKVENPLYEELRKQLSVAEVDVLSQRRRMESLLNLQEQEQQRAQRVAANQAQFSELTRDYDVIQKTYDGMLQRKEAARLSMILDQEGQGISYRIQEPATFPIKPLGFVFWQFAIVGPILGLLLPLGLLIAFVMVDPHMRSARILQNQLPDDIDLLGVVPHFNSPLGERLLRKDMLGLLAIALVSMALYLACAIYWQVIKG